jgi:exoribonuclease-2
MAVTDKHHRLILQRIARRVMIGRGPLPDYSKEALAELDAIQSPAIADSVQVRDRRSLLWCSIDNDDSRNLDQRVAAEKMPDGPT